MSINILLVDDHKILRDGLNVLIAEQKDMKIVGEAENGHIAVRLAQKLKPNIVIMDIAMPELNGIEATRIITASTDKIKVLILSMTAEKRFIIRALRAGAMGYILKTCASKDLLKAIRAIHCGTRFLCQTVKDIVIQDYINNTVPEDGCNYNKLTQRERQVLQLLAEGKSTKDAAAILHVSTKTIESHRSQLMAKLKTRSIAGLTKLAIREGLTEL